MPLIIQKSLFIDNHIPLETDLPFSIIIIIFTKSLDSRLLGLLILIVSARRVSVLYLQRSACGAVWSGT